MSYVDVFDKAQVQASFSRFASTYQEHAFLQKEIGRRLIEKARMLKASPRVILDLGAGSGITNDMLFEAFPKAQVIALDLSYPMLERNQQSRGLWRHFTKKIQFIQADMESLPLKPSCVDMVFSNCTLQWATDLESVFSHIKRVLKPEGTLFFSTFGPQTLKEMKTLWSQVDDFEHVHPFVDYDALGDALGNMGFLNPVMDLDTLNVTYTDFARCMGDLKNTGARNLHANRRRGLTPPSKIKQLKQRFEEVVQAKGVFSQTWEAIYGHAICQKPTESDISIKTLRT